MPWFHFGGGRRFAQRFLEEEYDKKWWVVLIAIIVSLVLIGIFISFIMMFLNS